MPKRAKELSPIEVSRLAKQAGFHAVGGVAGLHLRVKDTLAASWILRVKIGDDRPDLGLGPYPEVTLARARQAAAEARELIRKGIDPRQERQAVREALKAAQAKAMSFKRAAELSHGAKVDEFRNEKHKTDWIRSLEMYAFPVIGELPVADVELPHVVSVLQPIWTSRTETATRVRQRMEKVFDWAIVSGYRPREKGNPAHWKGLLEHTLPKPSKIKKKKHHPALPWQRVPEFMAELRKREGMGARALEFAILTAARSREVRLATWDEIDFEAKVWTVPAEHMKGGKTHRVPLAEPAIALLKALPRFEASPYVFPAVRGGPLSDMTISAVCRRMHAESAEAGGRGWLDPKMGRVVVPHGFRSSFKDWCRSSTSYADEVSELALAHVNDDKTRAAYARDELLPQRTRLMRDWSRYCYSPPRKASVAPIRGSR